MEPPTFSDLSLYFLPEYTSLFENGVADFLQCPEDKPRPILDHTTVNEAVDIENQPPTEENIEEQKIGNVFQGQFAIDEPGIHEGESRIERSIEKLSLLKEGEMTKCTQCAQFFKSDENLRRHSMKHTEDPQWTCAECSGKFTTKRGLALHKSRSHVKSHNDLNAIDESIAHSSTSSHIMKSITTFNDQAFDTENVDEDITKVSFECSECKKNLATRFSVDRHYKIVHMGYKAFECQICNTTFSTKQNLETHTFKVHGRQE